MKCLAVIVLLACSIFAGTFSARAQSVTTIHSFTIAYGSHPLAGLTLGPDGSLYGTTSDGGTSNHGTVFKLATNGTWSTLAIFNVTNGSIPQANLTLGPDGNLYGTTTLGGSNAFYVYGTVFKITTNGTLTTLVSFDSVNTGASPRAALTLGPDGSFYGTADQGGLSSQGTVFKVTTNGTLTGLLRFQGTNGSNPLGPLILGADGNFYGTTYNGGAAGHGTVFKVTTSGTLTTLVNFNTTNGANPAGGLILGQDGNFYGTTAFGGSSNAGTVFKVTTNGMLTTLASFNNTNGVNLEAGLTLGPDGLLYGTTYSGGTSGYGTVFNVTTNGTLTTLASFTSSNGSYPAAGLTLGQDGSLYGTTQNGGVTGTDSGTVFKITTNGSLTTLITFHDGTPDNSHASLTLGPGGILYGTTYFGGAGNVGRVFKVTTNGLFTTLVDFAGTNGTYPQAGLIIGPDGSFYGTTSGSSVYSVYGTVFKVTTDGNLTTVMGFKNSSGYFPTAGLTIGLDGSFFGTTSSGAANDGTVFKVNYFGPTTLATFSGANGADPYAGLTLGPDGNFYGACESGGTTGTNGTIFQVTPNGTLTTLVNFNYTNGSMPAAALTLGLDGNFYGTTVLGGTGNYGTIFKVSTNGLLATLVSFNGSNGYEPIGGLVLGPDANFYGTTSSGGTSGYGTVFKVTTNGALTPLVSFNNTNGSNPQAALTLGPDGNFYGVTLSGGSGTAGTIYRLNLPPDFIASPSNQFTIIGGSATFNCQAFGSAPFAYQWLSNGVPITGATSATLHLNSVSAAGSYQIVITNAYGSITSQVASLLLPPKIYAISNTGTGSNWTVFFGSYPNTTNRLWATTNVALPFAQWQLIATNVTDSNGLAQFLDTNTPGTPRKFYRLSYP